MNHLEQLVSEWLQYRGYFVRNAVLVGPRQRGGYEGELDIVAANPATGHLVHIECSLDALSDEKRQLRFARKFACGQRFVPEVLAHFAGSGTLDQIVILQFASGRIRDYGGGRLVTVAEFLAEVRIGLAHTSPARSAVPATLSLLRTLQLAYVGTAGVAAERRLIPLG